MRVLLAVLLVMAGPVTAHGHVVVVPEQSAAGGWERYSILVPTEKESATVRIELKLPTGIDVIAVESKPGWEGHYDPFPIGAAHVEWKGGRIPSGQFMSFEFLAWNPPVPRVLEWQATQWYEDGTSDHWGGGQDAEHASRTTLTAGKDAHGGMHRHDVPSAPKPASPPKH